MAAQLWSRPETSHIVMDSTLCAALSLEFERLLSLVKEAAPVMMQQGTRCEGATAQPYHEWMAKYNELMK